MTSQALPIPSPLDVWTELQPLPILASARPCWHESAHHRFAWEDDASTTGLTSTAGWISISPEGGP